MKRKRLTRVGDEFVLQVVVGLFGHQVGGAVLGLVLVQEAADLLDPPQQVVVVLVHQTLNPAARRAFRTLMEAWRVGRKTTFHTGLKKKLFIRFETKDGDVNQKTVCTHSTLVQKGHSF